MFLVKKFTILKFQWQTLKNLSNYYETTSFIVNHSNFESTNSIANYKRIHVALILSCCSEILLPASRMLFMQFPNVFIRKQPWK